ncbi:pyrroline-5-carboxylate reductase [Rhizobium sp. Root1203]|uniref:pyrroline-5-carboxylate reductase n=1 Tax=Rhizobium sp. Root1203 TaxID=1736427 RepID=UPI00070D2A9B|nr:pyrroline-5-carboxylate reductase [Rhizobium sp. Root1203]KQV21171.1 pyrroline-5-carboxylate reductase [Rhizobium sp. Root1203]
MIYGFIGTGTITAAMIEGMMSSALPVSGVIVSPRNADLASSLAERFSQVRVATSNQAVADEAEVLVLAVRPQIAEDVLTSISIPPGRTLISVIAATSHEMLSGWTGYDAAQIVRAIPLPFVSYREGVTAIFPANSAASKLFGAIGQAIESDDQDEFDVLAAASAMMGTYYGLMENISGWMESHGMPEHKARAYLTQLFGSLSQVAARSPSISYDQLRRDFSTIGGLNEQVFKGFHENGGSVALIDALEGVLARIKK